MAPISNNFNNSNIVTDSDTHDDTENDNKNFLMKISMMKTK